ncbi:MAG: type II secretion system protein [Actinobacteria bacterium]|nr:type II secretion system protein [Actinomycetota bacterium]
MHLSAGRHGFSLIEAVVAVAILGLACVAVSGVLSATLHAERSLERRRHLEAVLAAEGERLAALPYYRRVDGPEWPASPASLVGEVFPHASPACNAPQAYYADGSGAAPAGTFVSDVLADDLTVHRVSRFVAVSPAGLEPVAPEALSAWAVWSDALPPAGLIEVELQASWRGLVVERRLVLSAVPPTVAPPVAVLEGRQRVS